MSRAGRPFAAGLSVGMRVHSRPYRRAHRTRLETRSTLRAQAAGRTPIAAVVAADIAGCPRLMGAVPHLAGRTDQERITDAVRQRVIAVGAASATVPATAMPDPPAGQTDSIRRWDQQFESPLLQRRVACEPSYRTEAGQSGGEFRIKWCVGASARCNASNQRRRRNAF